MMKQYEHIKILHVKKNNQKNHRTMSTKLDAMPWPGNFGACLRNLSQTGRVVGWASPVPEASLPGLFYNQKSKNLGSEHFYEHVGIFFHTFSCNKYLDISTVFHIFLVPTSWPKVDSLTKSPAEFWKVWTTFYPALVDFSELLGTD